MGEKEEKVRCVSLRSSAFLGESVEPLWLRLQGLNLASIPEGVVRPSLHFTMKVGKRGMVIRLWDNHSFIDGGPSYFFGSCRLSLYFTTGRGSMVPSALFLMRVHIRSKSAPGCHPYVKGSRPTKQNTAIMRIAVLLSYL
ncbi:hypothetical protein VL06_12655 [Rossellomorea marisflavi]|nr:hypothetical protein VL06_12655 [Rossellomorea marisflavi]